MLDESRSPFASIPGTLRPPHGLFIDRWGTLLCPEPQEPPAQFDPEFLAPGAVEALFRAQQSGWLLYLIGNEESVAFGRLSKSDWKSFETGLLEHLEELGVSVARSYACLDHPEAPNGNPTPSVFLLPNTGAFYHAQQFDGIQLEDSWVVGDDSLELAAGDRAACHLAAIGSSGDFGNSEPFVDPDLLGSSLVEAIEMVLESDVYTRP